MLMARRSVTTVALMAICAMFSTASYGVRQRAWREC